MNDLSQLWKQFGDIPLDNNDAIEEPFLHFPVGTDRMEIWHWFDENDLKGVAHLLGIPQ